MSAPVELAGRAAGAVSPRSPYIGPNFCTKYGAVVGPQLVIKGVKTDIYECGNGSPYTNESTPFDDNGSGYDPGGSFQCVELSLRFEDVFYGKNTLYDVTGTRLDGGKGVNVVNYLHTVFKVPVAYGNGAVAGPKESWPAPVAGNILSLGPTSRGEPSGHTAVIESVTTHPGVKNYTVTIVSQNAPTTSTIQVINGRWPTLWSLYDEYNWTMQSGSTTGQPFLSVTTPSTSSSPPNAGVGSPYSFQLSAGGVPGPYNWSLAPWSGPLPRGLALSSSGLISGTAKGVSKLGPFTVEVVAGGQYNYAVFSLWALRGIKSTTTTVPSTCWGRCGGPEGPVGGYFDVTGKTVQDFQDTQACLGATPAGFTYYLQISSDLPISSSGAFSYSGPASVWNGMGKTGTRVWATLTGTFTSTTRASITLEVTYKQCDTYHLTIEAVPN